MDGASYETLPPAPFRQDGRAGAIWRLALVNLLLSICTLGFWRFWGKTRVRRYLWQHTSFLDEPLEYTGTGWELCRSFLIAVLLVVLPLVLLDHFADSLLLRRDGRGWFLKGAVAAVGLLLVGVGLYSAWRYRLTRTRWRGIRGGQSGSALLYGLLWGGWTVLAILTLGLATPWRNMALMRYRLGHAWFGDRRFSFDGRGRDLFTTFLYAWATALVGVALLALAVRAVVLPFLAGMARGEVPNADPLVVLSLPAGLLAAGLLLGIAVTRYLACEWRYVAGRLRFGTVAFAAEFNGRQLAWVYVPNALLGLFTLGLGRPYAALRVARFVTGAVTVQGGVDFAAVGQSRHKLATAAEGLASSLDLSGI